MPDSYPASYPISYPVSYPVPEEPAVTTLMFTEIYPSPDTGAGEQEWLEIYNYGDSTANLTGWYLRDASNKIMLLPEWGIQSGQYLVIVVDAVSLNNSGDIIELIDSKDKLVDKIEYPSIKKQQDWSRLALDPNSHNWGIGLSATPGLPNNFPKDSSSSASSHSSQSASASSSKQSAAQDKSKQPLSAQNELTSSRPEYQLPDSYMISVLSQQDATGASPQYYQLPIWPVILALSMIMLVMVMFVNRQIILKLATQVVQRLRALWLWWWKS